MESICMSVFFQDLFEIWMYEFHRFHMFLIPLIFLIVFLMDWYEEKNKDT